MDIRSAKVPKENIADCYKSLRELRAYKQKPVLGKCMFWADHCASAQCSLGLCYYDGEGVPQNYTEAVRWTRKAAEQGDVIAQKNLGVFYDRGDGVPQNYAEAVKWYQKAAEQGNAGAQYNLGVCYEEGQGVPQNYNEAVKWYRMAAERGLAEAQDHLAHCYCDSDKSEHVKWLRKAAEQGHEKAQHRLSIILGMGGYLPEEQQDIVEAYKWMRIRAEKESDGIIHSNIKEFMTPEQIQKGEVLAHEYLSKATRQQNN